MRALLFNGPGKIEVKEFNLPALNKSELLVQIEGCGVCGTDFHIFKGEAPSSSPVILGHEFTGIVADVKGDLPFKKGNRVAVDPNIYCGYCQYCRKGKINFCENLKALGVTLNGGMAQYTIVPASQAYIIPNELEYRKAIFAEPVSCCVHGINQASVMPGDKVAIVGSGTIGLIMLQLARLRGASEVFVFDPLLSKRDMARELGADYQLNPKDKKFFEEFLDISKGGADVVIECVGNADAANTAMSAAKKGSTVVIFGLASPTAFINLYLQSFFHKEINLKSSLLNPFTFQASVDLIVSGKLKLDLLKPDPVILKQEEIFKMFENPVSEKTIKYMITPNNNN